MPGPETRVRERIARWMELTGLSQRDFAKTLKKSQVWLYKVLAGEIDIRLSYLDQVADAMRTTPSELVRTDEERYQLELTPTEVRVIEQLRRHPETYTAIVSLLRIAEPTSKIEKPPKVKLDGPNPEVTPTRKAGGTR